MIKNNNKKKEKQLVNHILKNCLSKFDIEQKINEYVKLKNMIQSYGDSESVKKFNSIITTLKHEKNKFD
jgi:hypothetical protein